MLKLHYSPTEVAKFLGITPRTVRTGLKNNSKGWDFPFLAAGEKILVPVHAFNRWYKDTYGIDLEEVADGTDGK